MAAVESRPEKGTIERVRWDASPYPVDLLDGCESALLLFAAGFLGLNDGIHVYDKGISDVVCVDTDEDKLRQMAALYPTWGFVNEDAFAYATLNVGRKWDVVSVDTWTGELMLRSLQTLELWCSLANKLVTATITREGFPAFRTPAGWHATLFPRSSWTYWLCLTPRQ